MGCIVELNKQHEEVFRDFMTYCVSMVPGQNLMCNQEWNRVGVR